MTKSTGTVFNIQHFCVNDGPGIRTTVFLKGCPLFCVWCHNPESQRFGAEMLFYKDKCVGCGRCRGITAADGDFVCYNGAREICGKSLAVDEILTEVLKDKPFYDSSDGGVTLSGGEPLAQFSFSLDLLKNAKKNGIHTAMETCGYTEKSKILAIAAYTDLFLFDCKETDSVLHKKYTGVGNEVILDNLKALSDNGHKIILRCPIIPGFNDRPEHFREIANIANKLGGIEHVEIEPFHQLGESKYAALGRNCLDIKIPDDAAVDEWIEQIRAGTEKKVRRA